MTSGSGNKHIAKLKAQLIALRDKIDAITVRERAMIFVGVLAVLYMGFEIMVLQPLDDRKKRLSADAPRVMEEMDKISADMGKLHAEQTADPDEKEKAIIAALKAEIKKIDEQLSENMDGLVTARNMTKSIRQMLAKNVKLKLKNLETLPTESLNTDESDTAEEASEVAALYKHTLRLELEGEYLDIVRYMRSLEALEIGFFWKNLKLKTLKYPTASVTVELFTLSISKGWVGV